MTELRILQLRKLAIHAHHATVRIAPEVARMPLETLVLWGAENDCRGFESVTTLGKRHEEFEQDSDFAPHLGDPAFQAALG